MIKYPLICGNWKMYKTNSQAKEFALEFKELYRNTDIRAAILAPYTMLSLLISLFEGTNIKVGAQNCHFEKEGAFTGEISIPMLKEIGIDYCIVGHSERRQYYNETDEAINKKLKALLNNDIIPILCVGENLELREANKEKDFVSSQLKKDLEGIDPEQVRKLVIAYEPIWAIGTGKTATPEQANEMCSEIRNTITDLYNDEISDDVVIQYGGSVKPENASDIMNMPEIDGALVGGASLNAENFMEIINF